MGGHATREETYDAYEARMQATAVFTPPERYLRAARGTDFILPVVERSGVFSDHSSDSEPDAEQPENCGSSVGASRSIPYDNRHVPSPAQIIASPCTSDEAFGGIRSSDRHLQSSVSPGNSFSAPSGIRSGDRRVVSQVHSLSSSGFVLSKPRSATPPAQSKELSGVRPIEPTSLNCAFASSCGDTGGGSGGPVNYFDVPRPTYKRQPKEVQSALIASSSRSSGSFGVNKCVAPPRVQNKAPPSMRSTLPVSFIPPVVHRKAQSGVRSTLPASFACSSASSCKASDIRASYPKEIRRAAVQSFPGAASKGGAQSRPLDFVNESSKRGSHDLGFTRWHAKPRALCGMQNGALDREVTDMESVLEGAAERMEVQRREDDAEERPVKIESVYEAALQRSEVERREADAERRQAELQLALERFAWAQERLAFAQKCPHIMWKAPGPPLEHLSSMRLDNVSCRANAACPRATDAHEMHTHMISGQTYENDSQKHLASPLPVNVQTATFGEKQNWMAYNPHAEERTQLVPVWADAEDIPDDASGVAVVDCRGISSACDSLASPLHVACQ